MHTETSLNGCLTSSPGPALPLDFHVLAVEGDVKMESIIRKLQLDCDSGKLTDT